MHSHGQRSVFHMSPRRNLLYRGSSEQQELQISREAQKLNRMIDSWPTRGSFPDRKKEIAADLLRGSLGLQESLIKLGKIEETCKSMAQTSRKRDCCFTMEEYFTGEVGMQPMGCRRFDAGSHQHGLRAVRNLRSSINCLEELKNVIRDSLYRQNLVSISSDDDKESSSSRSQKLSTGVDGDCKQRHETGSSSHAAAAVAEQKKARPPNLMARPPNLIARLMGLEDAPPEQFRPLGRTETRRRNSHRQRPFLGLELPDVGKVPLMERQDHEREMLQETNQTMQFNGSSESVNPQIGSPVEENVGNFPAGDQVPTFLVMRPVHSASLDMEEMQKVHMSAGQAAEQENLNFQSPALELPKKVENRAKKGVAEAKKAAKPDKTKLPASSPDQKQLKKGAIRTRKKTKGTQKAAVDKNASEEKKDTRSTTAASGSQIKKTSSIPRNPEKNPAQVKNRVLTQKDTLHHEHHGSEKPAPRNHIGIAKGRKVMRAKPVKETVPIIVEQADTPNSEQDSKNIIIMQENNISPEISTSPSDLLPSGAEHQSITSERDVSGYQVETERKKRELEPSSAVADTRKNSSFHIGVLPKRSHGGGILCPSHAPNGESTAPPPAGTFDHIKSLLLSNPSFLHRAHELFNLHHQQPTDCRSTETEKKVADNSKLLVDCAGELMTYKHYLLELVNHPLWISCSKSSVTKISMNQLVEEISGEIQELDYSGCAGITGAPGDGLYSRLERAVKSGGVWANGAWEQGWSEAIPVEEADAVVHDVLEYIFEFVVEEVAVDLLNS